MDMGLGDVLEKMELALLVDVAAAKEESYPCLTKTDGTGVADTVAAKGTSDPGLTEADETEVGGGRRNSHQTP